MPILTHTLTISNWFAQIDKTTISKSIADMAKEIESLRTPDGIRNISADLSNRLMKHAPDFNGVMVSGQNIASVMRCAAREIRFHQQKLSLPAAA